MSPIDYSLNSKHSDAHRIATYTVDFNIAPTGKAALDLAAAYLSLADKYDAAVRELRRADVVQSAPAFVARIENPTAVGGRVVRHGELCAAIGDGLRAEGYSYDRLTVGYETTED